NEILEGNSYRFGANNAQAAGPSHLAVIGRAPSINLGAVIRGNVLHNHARLRVISESSEVAVENVIVEGNTVRDSAVGLEVRNAKGALYRGNTFERCRREVVDLDRQTEQWRKAVEQEVPRDRALVAWSFDEARGRKIPGDCALPGADMTARVFGRVELVDGVRGRALRFDGNTYVEVDSDAARMALNLRNFTIAAWINPDVVKGRWGIVSKRTGHAGTPFVLATRDAALAYEATDDEGKWTTYNFASPPVLAAGQWQHVALVVEEGKRATLYLNGRPVATNEIKGQKLDSNDMPLRIGWEAWGGDPPKPDVPGFFHGAIDELSIWARALTDAEIGKLASTLAP
ncbi:MAG: LamG domain-containing protein, partial [Armatimonadetes bacterium]|nr:LamG domain-containing protein [Armatimonadota bacterium]